MTELQQHQIPSDLRRICRRVQEKSQNYQQYNFSQHHNDFLKAFFDLAQEYDTLEDFYRVCVAVPLEMIGVSSALHICRGTEEGLALVCSSERGVLAEPEPASFLVQMHESPYEVGDSFMIPIFSKQPFEHHSPDSGPGAGQQRQTTLWNDVKGLCEEGRTLGIYEVRMFEGFSEADKFFFIKYANRIGYNLDNRLIALQNIEHLKFINTLVVDIEHNIIVPNMYFRHLYNQLKKKILELSGLKGRIEAFLEHPGDRSECRQCCQQLQELQDNLLSYHQEIVKHHTSTSLFLESLFRREHFERGHLVLRPKRCFIEKEVIAQQLEHYASRLKAARVTVEKPRNMVDEEFSVLVDIGLLAQVYANLFSNAAKYTREIIDQNGKPRKTMAYGREIIQDFPTKGHKGIKFNVFTTGPVMTETEGSHLFHEGVRGEGCEDIPGTGHGLSFIRQVVEMHGGVAGYEPTPQGNNFYFILPMPPLDYPPMLLNEGL
ncbi:sensor histidine kinase [Desulfogranum mediterraneum]|uniref:sensor histidine kinase n=1 Tax=Desulfogranum mediterraneum TaxID=160661 RepID=UPI0003F5179B|nr:HAMP domain-containing sensor histidine kinase [Desulfogranum mediterraneum]